MEIKGRRMVVTGADGFIGRHLVEALVARGARVSMGICALSSAALTHIAAGEKLGFPDLIVRLLSAGERVRAVAFDGYWLDIGRHDDFARAQEEFSALRGTFLPEDR